MDMVWFWRTRGSSQFVLGSVPNVKGWFGEGGVRKWFYQALLPWCSRQSYLWPPTLCWRGWRRHCPTHLTEEKHQFKILNFKILNLKILNSKFVWIPIQKHKPVYVSLGLDFVSQSLDSHDLAGGGDGPDSVNACAVPHVNTPSGSFVHLKWPYLFWTEVQIKAGLPLSSKV